jgi:hypothetical protein
MKLFKDAENNVFAYESDGSQDYLIGEKVALTQAEIDAREAKIAEEQEKAKANEQAIVNAKASALIKLAALGLTQDEFKALVG